MLILETDSFRSMLVELITTKKKKNVLEGIIFYILNYLVFLCILYTQGNTMQ